jgi:hypothetical protein
MKTRLSSAAASSARDVSWLVATSALVGLTALGFTLRVIGIDQSLFADELSTYWVSTKPDLEQVMDAVQTNQEITPPLYFILAWIAAKAGDPLEWLRVPSLLAGTAMIPLTYLLGVKTVGRPGAVLGSALVALSPFLIFYSIEARAYGLMTMLVLLSTLALLAALESGGMGWWAAYAVCAAAAMYTHYTAIFVLVAQAAWAAWAYPRSRGALFVASAAAALAFVPWLPSLADDSASPTQRIIELIEPFGFDALQRVLLRWSLGQPLASLSSLPGAIGLVLVGLGLGVALVGLSGHLARRRRLSWGLPPRLTLAVLLAVATPLGAALYSLVSDDLFFARNLTASWPGLALAAGAFLVAVPVPFRIASTALVLSAFALGAVKTLDPDVQRPDYRGAAEFVDRSAGPQDPVVDDPLVAPAPVTALQVSLEEPHRFIQVRGRALLTRFLGYQALSTAAVRRRAASATGRRLVAVASGPPQEIERPPPAVARWLPSGFELSETRLYRGYVPSALFPGAAGGRIDLGVYVFTERRRRSE